MKLMKIINTHQAKTHLSRILEEVSQGKVFILGKANTPIAKLSPYKIRNKKRHGGQLKGKVQISKDFDLMPEQFLKNFK